MQARMRIELPFPGKALSPNWRGYWAQRWRAAQELKQAAYLLAKANGTPPECRRAIVQLIYVVPSSRIRDPDNFLIMAKPAIDGLVAAGVFPDDSSQFIRYCPVLFRVTRKESPKLIIEVRNGWR